jgi:hypothetical protein
MSSSSTSVVIEKPWEFNGTQVITIRDKKYTTHDAIRMAEDLPVRSLPLMDFNISSSSPCSNNLRDFVAHMKATLDADLSYPIILNQDGEVIDGKHRLAKALLEKRTHIDVKRFETDPGQIWEWDS